MSKQGKNTLSTTKNYVTPIKTTDPITVRLEQPNTDEAEENTLKITLGECLRPLKGK